MSYGGAFLGMSWEELRSLGCDRTRRGASSTTLVRSDEHVVTASWWPAGSASEVRGHGTSHASIRVLEGELVEERWTRGVDHGWVYEQRRLRAGDSVEVPPGTLHRLAARRSASVITTCSPPPGPIAPIEPAVVSMLEMARTGMLEATSTSVELWAPAPEDVADSDA